VEQRIRYLLDSATPEQRNAGVVWYESAHVWCEGIAAEYGIPLYKACALVAVLSPANNWRQNMLDTISVVKAWRNGKRDAVCATYGRQVTKAYAILDSLDYDMLPLIGKPEARKTRAFYDNILCYGDSQAVTVDRHIARAMGMVGEQAVRISAAAYASIAAAFVVVAAEYNILPSQAQAIVWCVVRGTGD
jgi:hypothetical protein